MDDRQEPPGRDRRRGRELAADGGSRQPAAADGDERPERDGPERGRGSLDAGREDGAATATSAESDAGSAGTDRRETRPVSAAVLTISSEGSLEDDPAGDAVVDELDAAGHEVVTRNLVRRSYDGVQSEVNTLVRREDVEALVATGGTGVEPDDVTHEAVRPLFDKQLPGFGELFRSLYRERVGNRVVAVRALAGIADGVPVFCIPCEEAAARLGVGGIVAPEVGPIVEDARPEEEQTDEEGGEADAGDESADDGETGDGADGSGAEGGERASRRDGSE